jgi:hypothetical protein
VKYGAPAAAHCGSGALRRWKVQIVDEGATNADELLSPFATLLSLNNVFAAWELIIAVLRGAMKLRAEITVDITAEDYIVAAQHQKSFEEFLIALQTQYPDAKLQIKERRDRGHDEGAKAPYHISIVQTRVSS